MSASSCSSCPACTCPACHGARYNEQTLKVTWQGKNIAEVLNLTVEEACDFFAGESGVLKALALLKNIGLGYLRLGQPATELSGGEAQRIKLATELQRAQRGHTLYVLDEPTTGLQPADVDKLMVQLQALVDAGNTVIVMEHELRVVAASDWVIDVGPGAGEEGGRIVAAGPPQDVARARESRTAPYLQRLFVPKGLPWISSTWPCPMDRSMPKLRITSDSKGRSDSSPANARRSN